MDKNERPSGALLPRSTSSGINVCSREIRLDLLDLETESSIVFLVAARIGYFSFLFDFVLVFDELEYKLVSSDDALSAGAICCFISCAELIPLIRNSSGMSRIQMREDAVAWLVEEGEDMASKFVRMTPLV